MRIKISLTILGMIVGIATTGLVTTTIPTQTAEAKVNDCTRDSTEPCSTGGGGGSDEFSSGGFGRHTECDATTPTCDSSGGSGANQDNGLVGGGGGKCDDRAISTQVCGSEVGGSGRHLKGEGNN